MQHITILALPSSLATSISLPLEILNAAKTITFDSLFTVLNTRQELVVTFLALLETMRLKLVRIQQAKQFDPIRLYLSADAEAQSQILEQYYSATEIEK